MHPWVQLLSSGRVKIGRLVFHPGYKPGERLICEQALPIIADTSQLRIGEIRVDRTMANRVDRHLPPALLRLGNGMMPLDP